MEYALIFVFVLIVVPVIMSMLVPFLDYILTHTGESFSPESDKPHEEDEKCPWQEYPQHAMIHCIYCGREKGKYDSCEGCGAGQFERKPR